jgi:hypothetical protein
MSFFIGLFYWWVAKMTDFFMGFVCLEGEGWKFVVFWKTLINGGNCPDQPRGTIGDVLAKRNWNWGQ